MVTRTDSLYHVDNEQFLVPCHIVLFFVSYNLLALEPTHYGCIDGAQFLVHYSGIAVNIPKTNNWKIFFLSVSYTGSADSKWCISDEHLLWLNDILTNIKSFLESWDDEIWL